MPPFSYRPLTKPRGLGNVAIGQRDIDGIFGDSPPQTTASQVHIPLKRHTFRSFQAVHKSDVNEKNDRDTSKYSSKNK
ncbi:hypothetical protein ACJ72_08790 [Emergomyces africanus]|uniref:Uncharacterized protein n=1 Tax=Emergomyces africanus TaxID=1955775 RepID=A0A1B7NJF3_9EURO|nr:hypothetical protein ACJ72_08790 [Emergomyces africanus]